MRSKSDCLKRGLVLGVVLIAVMLLTVPAQAALVAHWKMDEASWSGTSADVADSSANSNAGTAANGANTVAGRGGNWGRAGSFDGSNDKVQVPDDNSLDIVGSITIALWVYRDGETNAVADNLVIKGEGTAGKDPHNYSFSITGSGQSVGQGYLSFDFLSGGYNRQKMDSALFIPVGVWTHVAVTYDQQNIRFYVNGAAGDAPAQIGAMESDNGDLYLGAQINRRYYDGLMDDVRIYNEALSQTAIQALMVPEPSSLALLGLGALVSIRRKRRS